MQCLKGKTFYIKNSVPNYVRVCFGLYRYCHLISYLYSLNYDSAHIQMSIKQRRSIIGSAVYILVLPSFAYTSTSHTDNAVPLRYCSINTSFPIV